MKELQEFLLYTDRLCRYDGDEYNKLPEVLCFFKDKKSRHVQSIEALSSLTCAVLKKAILSKRVISSANSEPEVKYDENLMNFHRESLNILLDIVKTCDNQETQIAAVKSLFSIMPVIANCSFEYKFPFQNFCDIMKSLITADTGFPKLLPIFEENLQFQDTSHRFWPGLELVISTLNKPISPKYVKNIISLINVKGKVPKDIKKTLCGRPLKFVKKESLIVRSVWDKLSCISNLPTEVHQLLIVALIEHMMPIIDSPITLTDYFMACLDYDGPVALVALQGIFTLIQKYNIDYPNIYNKLYTMFKPNIFTASYKPRFYFLADVFLTSTHLPETTVAGFIKRMSRMTLVAPPEDIIIYLAFITNLLIRHPSLHHMVHNPVGESVIRDPYDEFATDPIDSHAIKSSLWEIKLLQNHILPSVANSATFIDRPLPTTEVDFGILLEVTTGDILLRESKKKMRDPPLTFERPNQLFHPVDSPFVLWKFPDSA